MSDEQVEDAPAGGASEVDGSSPFHALLEVQDHDTVADQLRHRRATLPERADLAAVRSDLGQVDKEHAAVSSQRGDLGTKQANLEHQIDASKARRSELEKRMYAGTISASRDLQAMDEEVRHLAKHISELEDRELELMEELEPLDTELSRLDASRARLEGEAARLGSLMAETEAEIDAELATVSGERDAAAAGVPAGLLSRYEQLRTKLGGTGAARLVGDSCSGCHLRMPAMEVERVRRAAPDVFVTCEQCGRILVR